MEGVWFWKAPITYLIAPWYMRSSKVLIVQYVIALYSHPHTSTASSKNWLRNFSCCIVQLVQQILMAEAEFVDRMMSKAS